MGARKKLGTAVALATLVVAAAPSAYAQPPTPGTGDEFFIYYVTTVAAEGASEAAVQSIIPLAHEVCDARAQGQSGLQAAHLVWAGKGVEALGVPSGSDRGDQHIALDIVNGATLAYCPQYNDSNW